MSRRVRISVAFAPEEARFTGRAGHPSVPGSRAGLALIVEFEISSEAYYNRRLKRPYWPGGASGITIGIGYDLGYCSAAQCRRDWGGQISDANLAVLETVCRLKAGEARSAVGGAALRAVSVPSPTTRENASMPTRASKSCRRMRRRPCSRWCSIAVREKAARGGGR